MNILSKKSNILLGFLVAAGFVFGTPVRDSGPDTALAQGRSDIIKGLRLEKEEEAPLEEEETGPVTLPHRTPTISPETFRMIETIEKKNQELKRREEEMRVKEQHLKALEEQIRKDIEKIEQALARSQEQIGVQDELIRENIAALVKAFSSMKPAAAATLIEALNEDLALQIISGMKSKVAGKVLSRLDIKVAKNISEKLAGQRKKKPGK